jgi:phosphoglycolate phosphatase-like HAD superfamily hydrolase
MIRCVAFDFDGTLVDSNQIKRQAFFDVVADYDPEGSVVSEVLDEIRPGDRYAVTREIARLLCERGGMPAGSDPEATAVRWAQAYTRRCEEGVSKCPEIPGATAALEALAGRGIALYVNSATPEAPLQRVVRLRSMSRRFRGILGGPASKLANLRRIGDAAGVEREELLFVGDGEDDRSAAASFGCPFAGVVGPGPSRFAQEPEICITDLSGLTDVVARLRRETP